MLTLLNDRLYGGYLNMTFSEIYPTLEEFNEDAKGMAASLIPSDFDDTAITRLYFLLLGRYANSSIAASDINRFKLQLFGIVFEHGGTWNKKVNLQEKIRAIDEEEAREGTRRIDNSAYNPALTNTSTESLDALPYINQQLSQGQKKGKLETYAQIYTLLEDDITENFISQFRKLFLWFVTPQTNLWYVTDEDDPTITNENM